MMLKLLATVSLVFAHFSAVPATVPNASQQFAKIDAETVGGCQAVFSLTKVLIEDSLRAMEQTKSFPSAKELAAISETHSFMPGNFRDFQSLFETRVIPRAGGAGLSGEQMEAWRKKAYDQQVVLFSKAYASAKNEPAELKATAGYATASTPAVLKCVEWYQQQLKIKQT